MSVTSSRPRLFQALHAEALKRGLDHDGLRGICAEKFGVASMKDLSDGQLEALYHDWTGKGIQRKSALPRRGYAADSRLDELVSTEDLATLARAFDLRGWSDAARQQAFIRRQLGAERPIRTRRDFWKVFSGVRAMNRRDGKNPEQRPGVIPDTRTDHLSISGRQPLQREAQSGQ